MPTTYKQVQVILDPPAAKITLANPPLNVIDVPMMEELAEALKQLEPQPEVSTIIFSGSEQNFSAGVDVAAHTQDKVREMLAKFHTIIRAIVNAKKVTIAVVRGNCLGGGAELAMVCDMVFTTRDAHWAFPEIKLGCFPPVASVGLAALVGQKRAAELVLTGRQISGAEALTMGLVNAAVEGEELATVVDETLKRLSKLSPASLAVTKKAVYCWDAMHFEKGLARAEQIYLEELMKTEDAQEGIKAWLEKRDPTWKAK
ncbi:MAG TPA: enoyl-CoA hydratase/isomerase family protein [Terriglobales bacterium]|jgi:cyclohexa-1,5-dienecarbonyl-CoA hydratase|nr:enoyl-CoA hydratase/isomerase family protein [Terriglobales bacterium]